MKPKSREDNLVIQNFDTETLIYDLTRDKAFCLNSTSALVWQFCDGAKSISEIADLMTEKLKMPVSEDFVWLAISDLKREELIEVGSEQPFFEGRSRREAIRKIGFASMIALPVISSLVAPKAVDAQSLLCGTNGQNCTTSDLYNQGTCCSGLLCGDTIGLFCRACVPDGGEYASLPGFGGLGCINACLVRASQQTKLCCTQAVVGVDYWENK
jgi:hypothetical protein